MVTGPFYEMVAYPYRRMVCFWHFSSKKYLFPGTATDMIFKNWSPSGMASRNSQRVTSFRDWKDFESRPFFFVLKDRSHWPFFFENRNYGRITENAPGIISSDQRELVYPRLDAQEIHLRQ